MSVAGSYVDNVRSVVTCVHDCAQGGGGGRPGRGAGSLSGSAARWPSDTGAEQRRSNIGSRAERRRGGDAKEGAQ